MKKTLLALAATATIAGGMLATASDAEARPYGRYYGGYRAYPVAYGYRRYGYYPRYYRRGIGVGGAVAAGVAGAVIGGALAAAATPSYYNYGYYGSPVVTYGYPAYSYPSYGYYGYGY